MTTAIPEVPEFDADSLRALRAIAAGLIGATAADGVLQHRDLDLSPEVFCTLVALRQGGYVELDTEHRDPRTGWLPARLTATGTHTMHRWSFAESQRRTTARARSGRRG